MAAVAYSALGTKPIRSWSVAAGGPGPRTPTPGRPDMRVYRRRRAVTLLVGTTVAVMLAVAIRLALAGPGGGALTTTGSSGAWPSQPIAARVHIVQPGDTLWSIVRSSGVRGDPRPAVDRLMGQMRGRSLQIGQRIVLP